MTIQRESNGAFPSDGKVLVLGYYPEPELQGRYGRRTHFWQSSQVRTPADIPGNIHAVLIYKHMDLLEQVNPEVVIPRLLACAVRIRKKKTFIGPTELREELYNLLYHVDTRIDPDQPAPVPVPIKEFYCPPTPQSLILEPRPQPRPEDGIRFVANSFPVTVTIPDENREEFIVSFLGSHADFKGDDDYEARRIFALLGGYESGVSIEQIRQKFRVLRARKFPPRLKPLGPILLAPATPQPSPTGKARMEKRKYYPPMPARFLRIEEAADRVSVSHRTIYNWIERGLLPTHRSGQSQLIDSVVLRRVWGQILRHKL